MTVFKNKHIIAAMIVAPMLAVLTYFLVDQIVREEPYMAVYGQAYPLVAKSNCRFSSGQCRLENASFSAVLSVLQESSGQQVLLLNSSHALQQATIGLVDEQGQEWPPTDMLAKSDNQTQWQLDLPFAVTANTLARVALKSNDAFYFAETTMQFNQYSTIFEQDFRK